jgi:hypothetical protein
MYMTNLAEALNAGDCSGWERDPQSFSKRVADHYLRTVMGLSLTARSIRSPRPGSVRWEVLYPNDIVIAVIFGKGFVAAARIHPWGPIRHYNYTCTPQGDLILSDRPLPSSVVSRRLGGPPPATAAPSSASSGAPAPAPACTNPLDATAKSIIVAAQDPALGIYGRAVRAVWDILRTYYPTEATKVAAVVYSGKVRGLQTTRAGRGLTATGIITVGRDFIDHTTDRFFARRVLQVGHELQHIGQYRAGMIGPANKAKREFLAHCWTALSPEKPGTGCVTRTTRIAIIDCALAYCHCMSAAERAPYVAHERRLLDLRASLKPPTAWPPAAGMPPCPPPGC